MSYACLSIDRELRYTYANRAAERIIGLRREEIIGRTIKELFTPLTGTQFESACRRAMYEGVTVHFEQHYQPFDRWFAETAYPSTGGITLYAHDITDRKRAEEALRESEERFRSYFELG